MPNAEHFAELKDACILLIDDDPDVSDVVETILRETGARLTSAKSIQEAKTFVGNTAFHVALTDIVMPDGSGVDLIRFFTQEYPEMTLIAITGHADRAMAISLEEIGVRSVITKPFSASQLRFTVCKELIRRNAIIKKSARMSSANEYCAENLVGESDYMKKLRKHVETLAQSDIPVLIQGPTGTGKEIIAKAIHRSSRRSTREMIIVNSSAIPEHLEESEFFGHSKGAFTGAMDEKRGIIKCADKSTLFLDEVGELSLRMQAKLLRVLDGHEYSRIGDMIPQKADFRLISATNRPLLDMIQTGVFRQDFYFRLKSGTVETKPLASHKEDIPLLTRHFMHEFSQLHEGEFSIVPEAVEALSSHEWPGNIRELKNAVEYLCTVSMKTKIITRENLTFVINESKKLCDNLPLSFAHRKLDFEKNYYVGLLAKHEGNIAMAAKEAGLHRPNLSKKLKLLGIAASDFKEHRIP
jgi:DNA-binding NtrC family response regulator